MWKLVPPRAGKTPYWYVRGKYCGIALDRSTGTGERRTAKPWELVEPNPPKTRCYYIRGTYLGIRLGRSTGTGEERAAKRILATWRQQAERGEFKLPGTEPQRSAPTFENAAVAYMRANGDGTYLEPIATRSASNSANA